MVLTTKNTFQKSHIDISYVNYLVANLTNQNKDVNECQSFSVEAYYIVTQMTSFSGPETRP